jgi:hypothetical protein
MADKNIKTKWSIPRKFINNSFVSFLDNALLVTDSNGIEKDTIQITGWGSVQEYSEHFTLQESYGIKVEDILKLLKSQCNAIITKKENKINYNYKMISELWAEIKARIGN